MGEEFDTEGSTFAEKDRSCSHLADFYSQSFGCFEDRSDLFFVIVEAGFSQFGWVIAGLAIHKVADFG